MAAIYMWIAPGEEVVYTTTLYPIEATEGILISADVFGGHMSTMPEDSMEMHMELLSGTLEVVLLEAPEQEDSMEMYMELVSGTLEVILVEAPEQTDSMEMYMELVDATLESKLVTTYHPDNGIKISADLRSGSSYMTDA